MLTNTPIDEPVRYGGTIAHGYLTPALARAATRLDQVLPPGGSAKAEDDGLDKLRFPVPTRVGEQVCVANPIYRIYE